MAQIPTDERRFKPPKVQPTVSYVRPTGPAPQSKLGSPSAVGFNPAYTPTVQPRPENKGFAAAATTPPKRFFPTKEFWADPTGYGQPLYDNFLSKILPSKERLDNSSFSYLNLLDPKNSFTPSMIPGIIGSAVPGGKAFNLLGEAIKSSGYADTIFQYGPLAALGVTAAKMFGNRNDPIAMARNLMPLFQSVVTGNVVGGLNDMTGLDWGPAAPAIYPKANLGFVNPQYSSSVKQEITPYGYNNMGDTYTEQDGTTRFVPWQSGLPPNKPVKNTGQPVTQNSPKLLPAPRKEDYLPGESTSYLDWNEKQWLDYQRREGLIGLSTPLLPPPKVPATTPWDVLKTTLANDAELDEYPWEKQPSRGQQMLDAFWKAVRENPQQDPYKLWDVIQKLDKEQEYRSRSFDAGEGDPYWDRAPDDLTDPDVWESYKKSLAVNPNLKLPLPSEEEISRYWASEGYFEEPGDELYAEKMQRWLNYELRPGEEDEYVRFMFGRDYKNDPNDGGPLENMSLQDWKKSVLKNYPNFGMYEGNEDGENKEPDTYIDPLGNEWDSKDQFDYYQQSLKDYAAGQELGPMQESVEDSTNRLAAQMAEGGERPVSYYQELLRQSFKTFEDLANAGTDFNRFPTNVTPNKWIEDNNTFLPSMMGTHELFDNPKYSSGLGAGTNRNTDFSPWDSKPRPPYYFDEYGNFVENNPLRSMGNETFKTLPMGQLGVSAQIQLRRDIFMGADLNKLPEPTKKAIYESFDMGWHPGLGDDEEDNSRMAGIFEAITGFPQPESNVGDVGDGEYDTGSYMVEEYPLMEYINSPESGLPNLADYLVPTGQDAEGRMTFEGDYYKWEQDFRKAWRDNPGLFRDTKFHPEFLPEWANPRYRDNAGE